MCWKHSSVISRLIKLLIFYPKKCWPLFQTASCYCGALSDNKVRKSLFTDHSLEENDTTWRLRHDEVNQTRRLPSPGVGAGPLLPTFPLSLNARCTGTLDSIPRLNKTFSFSSRIKRSPLTRRWGKALITPATVTGVCRGRNAAAAHGGREQRWRSEQHPETLLCSCRRSSTCGNFVGQSLQTCARSSTQCYAMSSPDASVDAREEWVRWIGRFMSIQTLYICNLPRSFQNCCGRS